ncbi:MAG: hypothetical protein HN712_18860 [Gemmatimonadetes bacterium]|nr:hypothetical protein [Gemmatimonadota bacterium]MBT7862385.1 hypothetical protein [Gemmatimonadota bacterium]
MRRRTTSVAIALLALAGTLVPVSAQTGAAFLDLGMGARAPGMGGALSAQVTGAEAVYYNPAGLAAQQGHAVLASVQPMSLDRTHATLAAAMNLRGGLAFGLTWIHASAGAIDARTGSGDVVGSIDDAQRAIGFALGTKINERVRIGGSFKVLNHEIDVPGTGTSTASGRAIDVGAQIEIRPQWQVAVGARNLLGKLSWDVRRAASQSSASEDDLPPTPYVGLGGAWHHFTFGVDAELFDMGGIAQPRLHLGAEADLSPMLSLRAGMHRIGDADGLGLPSLGISIRPMHREALQLHYAWVADDLGAGGRSILSVGGVF